MTTDPLDLDALERENAERRRVKEAATVGPWKSELQPGQTERHTYSHQVSSENVPIGIVNTQKKCNADFIAAARNDPVEDRVDQLLAECRRLRAACEVALPCFRWFLCHDKGDIQRVREVIPMIEAALPPAPGSGERPCTT